MTLRNPLESLGNVSYPQRHKPHGTRIGELVAPGANWKNRGAIKRAIESRDA